MNNPYEAYRKQAALAGNRPLINPAASVATSVPMKNNEEVLPQGAATEPAISGDLPEAATELLTEVAVPSFVPAYQETDPEPEAEKPLNPYFVNSVMTASPEKLTLMLYEGALRFMSEAVTHIDKKEMGQAHRKIVRAQDIFLELMATLKMEYSVAEDMFRLYSFIVENLIQANIKKDPALIKEMMALTQEFRDTWAEAMKNITSIGKNSDSVIMDIQGSGK